MRTLRKSAKAVNMSRSGHGWHHAIDRLRRHIKRVNAWAIAVQGREIVATR